MAVTSSNNAPVTRDVATWPVYATKAACLVDLEAAIGGGQEKVNEIIMRLSNTDTSVGWTDKGSQGNN